VLVVDIAGGSQCGIIYVLAMAVVVVSGGRHGATHDLAQRGVDWSGRESVMPGGRFCSNAVGPPKWQCEAMGSVVWVHCTNVCRVY